MIDPEQKATDEALAEIAAIDPPVPHALMAAVLRDAAMVQPRNVGVEKASLWDTVLDLIGGWPAVSGLAAAGVAGLWLGVAPPVALESAAINLLGTTQTLDVFGVDTFTAFNLDEVSP